MSAFHLGSCRHVEIAQERNIPPNPFHRPKGGTLSCLQMLVCFPVILCCCVSTSLTLAVIKKRFLCLWFWRLNTKSRCVPFAWALMSCTCDCIPARQGNREISYLYTGSLLPQQLNRCLCLHEGEGDLQRTDGAPRAQRRSLPPQLCSPNSCSAELGKDRVWQRTSWVSVEPQTLF